MSARAILIVLFFLPLQLVYTQTSADQKNESDIFTKVKRSTSGQGKVTIKQDESINSLMLKYVEYRKKENTSPGYRIRIFSDTGQTARQKANSERARFSKIFPDITTYAPYEEPYFKVYVGDFRSRSDAYRAFMQIKKDFPRAFIVPTKINPPKI